MAAAAGLEPGAAAHLLAPLSRTTAGNVAAARARTGAHRSRRPRRRRHGARPPRAAGRPAAALRRHLPLALAAGAPSGGAAARRRAPCARCASCSSGPRAAVSAGPRQARRTTAAPPRHGRPARAALDGRGAVTSPARSPRRARRSPPCPRPLGLVPTMGALHDGHLALVAAAAATDCARGGRLDLREPHAVRARRGPRALSARRGPRRAPGERPPAPTLVFAPSAAEMYPADSATTVHVDGPLAAATRRRARPGHFDGVATIVTKLLTIVAPDRRLLRAQGRPAARRRAAPGAPISTCRSTIVAVAHRARARRPGHELAQRLPHAGRARRRRPSCTAPCWPAAAAAEAAAPPRTIVAAASRRVSPARRASRVDYVAVVDPDRFDAARRRASVPSDSLHRRRRAPGRHPAARQRSRRRCPTGGGPMGVATHQASDPRGGRHASPPASRAARRRTETPWRQ